MLLWDFVVGAVKYRRTVSPSVMLFLARMFGAVCIVWIVCLAAACLKHGGSRDDYVVAALDREVGVGFKAKCSSALL